MSTVVGLSNKEITAISDASYTLHTLHRLTANERQLEVAELLEGILKRSSPRWGGTSGTRGDDEEEERAELRIHRLLVLIDQLR